MGGLGELCREVGALGLLAAHVAWRALLGRFDRRELARNLASMGADSLPIVVLTAFFTGGIMVIQSGVFVKRFGAYGLLGFGTGYAILREVGPLLIGLMFSGRVGANNTAELGTMAITEQIDGLRALAIDPVAFLVVPRVLAMMIALFCLLLAGDAVALLGGALLGKWLLGVGLSSFFQSMSDNLRFLDLGTGLTKAVVFGFAIALSSCHFGVGVRGGAPGVGRAVNSAVVASALAMVLSDQVMTVLFR